MDAALQLCLPYLRNSEQSVLCLDENIAGEIQQAPSGCQVISNRFDVAAGFDQSIFNDWQIEQRDIDCLAFRLSKEKAVNHCIINQAIKAVKDGGLIVFAGQKNQGIKSYAKAVKKLLGNCEIEKHGMDYLCLATAHTDTQAESLDDQDYHQLRATLQYKDFEILSKPGQFGWNKLDQGSLLLLELLKTELEKQAAKEVLDIGCGYGLLSIGLVLEHKLDKLIATDNNAAAIASCLANLTTAQQNWNQNPKGSDPFSTKPFPSFTVVADDCAKGIAQKVDTVICNPPFHQGFDVENQLTDKFIKSARDHLVKGGRAYFVVNSFIGIEKKAKKYFEKIDCLENNRQFKVLRLS